MERMYLCVDASVWTILDPSKFHYFSSDAECDKYIAVILLSSLYGVLVKDLPFHSCLASERLSCRILCVRVKYRMDAEILYIIFM